MHSRAEGFWHVCGESWADHGCLRYVSKSAIFVNFSAHSLLSPRVMHANILNQQIIPHNPPTPVHSRDKNNQKPSRMTCPTFVTSSTRRSFFVSPGSRTHAPTEYPEEKSQAKRRRTLNSWHTVAENCHQPRKGEGAGAAIDESRFFSMPLIWIARILTPVLDHFSSIPIATKYSVCRIQARVTDLSRRQVTRFQHYIWANVALSSVHPSYHISPSVVHAATRGYRKLNRELDFICPSSGLYKNDRNWIQSRYYICRVCNLENQWPVQPEYSMPA